MQKYIEVSGKTEDEAIAEALRKLNLNRDDVSVEIIERAKTGFLRIGSAPAVVRVYFEAAEEPKAEPIAPAVKKTSTAPVEKKPAVAAQSNAQSAIKTREFLEGLLERMDIKAEITIAEKEDGSLFVELSGDGMGAVIGRRGETLDAIQHLTNYAVNRGNEERTRVSIDAENYRSKREEALERLAEKMAAKALKYKRSMALEPMNSYERHIIHTALQNYEGVTTCSTGTEPNRRVVISCEKSNKE